MPSILFIFATVKGVLFSPRLKNIIHLRYKTLLRRLQTSFEKKAKSILVGSRCDNQIKYNCSFSTDGKKLDL